MALNFLVIGLYLLPLSFLGQGALLLGLAGFWVGVIVGFWLHHTAGSCRQKSLVRAADENPALA